MLSLDDLLVPAASDGGLLGGSELGPPGQNENILDGPGICAVLVFLHLFQCRFCNLTNKLGLPYVGDQLN